MVVSTHEPQGFLDVVNCTLAMAEGGVKDACCLPSQYIPTIKEVDCNHIIFDLATLNRAGNVQKGAQEIAAKFPKVSIIHQAEHIGSLFWALL